MAGCAQPALPAVAPRDGQTLARASVEYVCINLDSGRAVRMPESFTRAYVITAHRAAGAPEV